MDSVCKAACNISIDSMTGHRASDITGIWMTAMGPLPCTAGAATTDRRRCTADLYCSITTTCIASRGAPKLVGASHPTPLRYYQAPDGLNHAFRSLPLPTVPQLIR